MPTIMPCSLVQIFMHKTCTIEAQVAVEQLLGTRYYMLTISTIMLLAKQVLVQLELGRLVLAETLTL
jgi:hypothetical protein